MQVWLGDKLVGELNVALPVGARSYRIMKNEAEPSISFSNKPLREMVSVETIELPIKKRHCCITDLEMESSPIKIMSMMRIPVDAQRIKCFDRMVTEFVWPVLMVSPDDYEDVFDLPDFQPV